MKKLSAAQREPLFRLIDYQRRDGREVVYYKRQTFLYPTPQDDRVIAEADDTLVGLWRECDYVYIHETELPPGVYSRYPTFGPQATLRLRQEALDYYDWMRKPGWQRWLIEQKRGWATEPKAVIVAVLTFLALELVKQAWQSLR